MNSPIIKDKLFKYSAIVFFIGFFIVGISIFSEYGISCDERNFSRLNGYTNYTFITNGDAKSLLACEEKYHGPSYEIFLYSAEVFLNLRDTRDIYLMRHFLNFLFFYISIIFFYLFGLKIFKKHGAALLCCLMLVASPRIFAESFYNSKDLIMLSACIIASYTAFVFIERQTIWTAIIHALICGFLLDIRIIGVLIPFLTTIFYLVQKPKKIVYLIIFIFYTISFTIAFWPVLWLNPVIHFIGALKEMSHFPIPVIVFYLGEFITSQNLPWHYVPVWVLITTPSLYILYFLIGVFFIVKNSYKSFFAEQQIKFALLMFATPVLSIIILNSAIYDSYRHIFFIYPFLILLAVYGFTQLIQSIKIRFVTKTITFLTAIFILHIYLFMFVNRPFQNVYFNFLAGENIRQNFELDYWGLSFRQALEYILENDKSKEIRIAASNEECQLNFEILPIEGRKRLFWKMDVEEADYYLTNFRYHPNEYEIGHSVFNIKVGGEKIMEVYKLK